VYGLASKDAQTEHVERRSESAGSISIGPCLDASALNVGHRQARVGPRRTGRLETVPWIGGGAPEGERANHLVAQSHKVVHCVRVERRPTGPGRCHL